MLANLFALVLSAHAAGASPAPSVSLAFQARVSDANRSRETWLVAPLRATALRATASERSEDLLVELTPRASDGQYILFSYKVQKNIAGRWIPLTSGDVRARNGRRTEVMVGGSLAANHLVQLAIQAQAGQPPTGIIGAPTSSRTIARKPRFQRL